jgi:hypothetical protein
VGRARAERAEALADTRLECGVMERPAGDTGLGRHGVG